MKRDRLSAIKDLKDIADALRIAGPARFLKEIQDIEYEIKKLNDTRVQTVYLDLILSHLIMSAKLRGCPAQP